jgi:hypothetical protein
MGSAKTVYLNADTKVAAPSFWVLFLGKTRKSASPVNGEISG